MSKSSCLRAADARAVYRLAGECRELGDDASAWQAHAFRELARLVDADLVFGGEQADLPLGRIRYLATTEIGMDRGFDRRALLRAYEVIAADPSCLQLLRAYVRRGKWGTASRRGDLREEREWRRSFEYDEWHRPMGIDHPLSCFFPISGAATETIGSVLNRAIGRPDFTARDAAVVKEAFAAVGPLVGGPLARFAEPSPAALPPRVRQVLKCLLEGDGDKQVARRLGISPHTVNVHTKAIFRHFGVQSRAELLARWVRRGWGGRCAWADAE